MSSGVHCDGRGRRPAPEAPLVFDPAEPVSVEMVPVGPGGKVTAPVLVLPGAVRICIDAFSGDAAAADWWYGLGTAAMTASLCYVDEDESEPAP
jgi:hypothetical protein